MDRDIKEREEAYYGSLTRPPALRNPSRFLESFFLRESLDGKRVLDFGCGTGPFSIFFAKRGAHVTGIDINAHSIRRAKENAKRHHVESLCRFLEGDGQTLPFENETFDHIISIEVLSFVHLDKAMREIARVLKPNGTVLIQDTLGHNPIWNLNRKIKLWRGKKTRFQVDHILKKEDFKCFDAHFSSVETRYFDLTTLSLFPFRFAFERPITVVSEQLAKLDHALLRTALLQPLAFKFVARLSNKKR